ncbi:MAG: hypothetical protein ABIT76_07690 [Chthoniobacterales bacterium]
MTNPNQKPRALWLTLYYLAILLTLLWMEMSGSFETPKFIYQGF